MIQLCNLGIDYIYMYTRYKLKSKKCMIQLYNLGIDYHDYCIVK